MTHAEFEAEPVTAVRWMLEIHRLYVTTGHDPIAPRRREAS